MEISGIVGEADVALALRTTAPSFFTLEGRLGDAAVQLLLVGRGRDRRARQGRRAARHALRDVASHSLPSEVTKS